MRHEENRPVQRPEWKTLEGRIRWLLTDHLKTDQRTLGEKAGFSDSTIGGYLTRVAKTRKRGAPDATMGADILAGISVAWKISPAWLLLGVGDPGQDAPPAAPPLLRDSPGWAAAVEGARAEDVTLAPQVFDALGEWPALPPAIPISVGLVLDLARAVRRHIPAAALPPSATNATPGRAA